MRVLLLTTDAYGGHGGIALYNRDVADALASMPDVDEIVVIARTMPLSPTGVPEKVRLVTNAVNGKFRYVRAALAAAAGDFDMIICGHVNLLPLAAILNLKLRAPLALMVYGIDVWSRPSVWARHWLRWVDAVWTISAITRERMISWAGLSPSKFVLLPNAIHMDRYGMAGKPGDVIARHGLEGRRVIMTLARLLSFERYKGVDEVLEVLPELLVHEPRLIYLVAGDGDDRPRLESKACSLGLQEHVVFAGFIPEAEKADYFRLADVFAMPGWGEGFGFVFLEALACGVPVVGSQLDGSREALLGGELGNLVDPGNRESVREGILRALEQPRGIPSGLDYFAWPRFRERIASAVHSLHSNTRRAA